MPQAPHNRVGELASQYGAMVFAVARRLTGNAEDAEDAMQEVFLKLMRTGGPEGGAREWGAYLRTMATTAGLDILRRRQGRIALSIDWLENIPDNGAGGPRREAERSQLAELLRRMLATLPAREAEVFGLRHFDDLSYEEIAGQMAMNAGQVGVMLHRTRKKLLEMLTPLLGGTREKEESDERSAARQSRV